MKTDRSRAERLHRRRRAKALVCAAVFGLFAQRAIADAIPTTPKAPIRMQLAPSFAEIANRPGVTAASLQRFIVSTHWDTDALPMTMPNPMLTPDEARAVSHYILSLRTH
jgi:hypothetical protein